MCNSIDDIRAVSAICDIDIIQDFNCFIKPLICIMSYFDREKSTRENRCTRGKCIF